MYEFFTTFPERHKFGFNLTNTAEKYLPDSAKLVVYYEGETLPESTSKVEFVKFDPTASKIFCERAVLFQSNKIPPLTKVNSPEYISRRYYMWDAKRFCWKSYCMIQHMKRTSSKHTMWIDSDVEFKKEITEEWIKSLINIECYGSFLDRPNKYTETGFLYFNTTHSYHKTFWQDMRKLYDDLELFNISNGWMDCQAYDYCRKKAESSGVKFFDLVKPELKDIACEVWEKSFLKDYSVHYKSTHREKT